MWLVSGMAVFSALNFVLGHSPPSGFICVQAVLYWQWSVLAALGLQPAVLSTSMKREKKVFFSPLYLSYVTIYHSPFITRLKPIRCLL